MDILAVPVSFGPYELLAQLEEGGMAEIYLARQSAGEALCVIKRISQKTRSSSIFRTYFEDEARLTQALHHPNVVTPLGAGMEDGEPYLVLEYIHGRPLNAIIRSLRSRRRRFPLPQALKVGIAALEGLAYVHQAKNADGKSLQTVLCDLSPSNLMVAYSGEVKLIDFGIANSSVSRTESIGLTKGKVMYMAPEQLRGMPLDHRADIYSMALCLLELISLEEPFTSPSRFALEEAIRNGDVNLDTPLRDVPVGVRSAIQKAVSLRPEDRFGSALEFADALRPAAVLRAGAPVSTADVARVLKVLMGDEVATHDESLRRAMARDGSRQATAQSAAPSEERTRVLGLGGGPASR